MKIRRSFVAAVATTALCITACGDFTDDATTAISEAATSATEAVAGATSDSNVAEGLTFVDGFMKAKPAADAPEGRG